MKNFTIITLFLSIILLSSSCESDFWGLEDSGVYGVVRDMETGNPIPNALVYITGSEDKTTQTDASGNYLFKNMKPGNYLLSAEAYRYFTPFVETTVFVNDLTKQDIEMEYHSLLSTHTLNFGTNYDELEIVVTNILDRPIDVSTEEDEIWMTVHGFISGLEPGQSEILTVRVNRTFMDAGNFSVPLIVDIEEDFGFDVYESYVVNINVQN